MLHNWSSRLMVPLMLIAATVALVAPAFAGVVCDCTWKWDNGTANELDFEVRSIAVLIDSGGYTYTDPTGTNHTLGASWTGYYLYLYEVKIEGDADNTEEPDWFQVDWGGVAMHLQGHINGSAGGGARTVSWTEKGLCDKANPTATPPHDPTPPGTWVTWTVSGTSGEQAGEKAGDWLGTLWAISGGPPKIGDGLVSNSKPLSQGQGEACVPTPEVPTLLLLMTSGVPMVGLGYLRRRRIA